MMGWLSEDFLKTKMTSAVLDMKKVPHHGSNISPAGLGTVITMMR